MKAIFPALPCVDNQPNELEADPTKGETKGAGPGFDALLALASTRTAAQSNAVKPLAPAVVLQPSAADLHPASLIVQQSVEAPIEGDAGAADAYEAMDDGALALTQALQSTPLAVVRVAQPEAQTPAELPQIVAPESTVTAAPQLSAQPALQAPNQVTSAESELPHELADSQALPVARSAVASEEPVQVPAPVPARAPAPPAQGAAQPITATPVVSAQHAVSEGQSAAQANAPANAASALSRSAVSAAPATDSTQEERATPASVSGEQPVAAASRPAAPAQTTVSDATKRAPEMRAPSAATSREDAPASAMTRVRKGERNRPLTTEQEPAASALAPAQPAPLSRAAELASQAAQARATAPIATAPVATARPASTPSAESGVVPSAAVSGATNAAPLAPLVADAPISLDSSEHAPDARAFATVLGAPDAGEASAAPLTSGKADESRAPGVKANPASPAPLGQIATDPETGARVVRIEYFHNTTAQAPANRSVAPQPATPTTQDGDSAEGDASAEAARALNDVAARGEHEAAPTREDLAPGNERELGSDAGRPEQGSGDGQGGASAGQDSAQGRSPQQAQAPVFQATEGQGMRGLDAVVASLLRAGNPNSDVQSRSPSARAVISAPIGQVDTQKSVTAKNAEKSAALLDGARKDALEQEEKRGGEREQAPQFEPLPVHVQLEQRPPDARSNDVPAPALPLPSAASLLPDPDAAAMGKLARGEGATIAIEHPELGPMNVVVQNENGRIDVRAVLETPRAAAVLRAHESALRYGIQQAGMTFGALRVRSRSGEPESIKSQGTSKRRRGQEWEA